MTILGISCYYHDAAACVVQDGRIVAAAQEERFTRKKHDPEFPRNAIQYCLREAGITVEGLDYVAFYDKPFLKFERLLESYLAYAPGGLPSFLVAMPQWIKKKIWIPDVIQKELGVERPVLFPEHHESHAASAFFPSPFQRAAFLTIDGVGEWATTSFGTGEGNRVRIHSEIHFPHSIGLLYSAFTYYTGFRVNSGEYKLMGLAPYGEPRFVQTILDELIDLKEDGSFKLNMRYFHYAAGLRMTNRRFDRLFGGSRREPESPLTQREMDLAASVQQVTEEAMLRMVRHIHRETGEENLCLAGGVALNCVANGRIVREGPFRNVWIQPAAGDAGGALGAALMVWHAYLGKERPVTEGRDLQFGSYLGPAYPSEEIERFLRQEGIPYTEFHEPARADHVAELLAGGNVVGWFDGRMEFGPRALGARSILADPRGPDVQRRVNVAIKFRESFRPFAPSVIREDVHEWFDFDGESPYMMLVADVRDAEVHGEGLERLKNITSRIPAVTHVDGSARIQTVSRETNAPFYNLLEAFKRLTGCPVLVNTSFNVRGEPIVCTPADALRCFRETHMDVLVLGPFVINKKEITGAEQNILTAEEAAARYGLD